MKHLLFFFAFIFSVSLHAQKFIPADAQSEVKFNIKNFGLKTAGSFKGLKGSINFDFSHPENSSFNVSVDANTVNTGVEMRDNHLKKEDYFDVTKFPVITIVSTKVQAVSGQEGSFIIFARLTIKGKTKDISFPFKAVSKEDGILFTGNFNINRRDFDVGGGTTVMSANVDISLNVFAKKN